MAMQDRFFYSRKLQLALAFALFLSTLAVFMVGNSYVSNSKAIPSLSVPGLVNSASNEPLFAIENLDVEDASNYESLLDYTRVAKPDLSVSECLHLMLLFGSSAEVMIKSAGPQERVSLLDAICSARIGEKILAESSLVRTHGGFRFNSLVYQRRLDIDGGEAHRDQTLAVLSLLGVPLSKEISLDEGAEPLVLAHALSDSIQSFHLGQRELPWTAFAYANYLPPRNSWRNRFGETYRFEDLATTLMEADLASASCGGLHVLQALTVLFRASVIYTDLIPARTHKQLEAYLSQHLQQVIQTQHSDGTWTKDWLIDCSDTSQCFTKSRHGVSREEMLLVTGHVLEWLNMLPASPIAKGREICSDKASRWITLMCKNNEHTAFRSEFCPKTHAILGACKSIVFLNRSL